MVIFNFNKNIKKIKKKTNLDNGEYKQTIVY